jgi:hypothetical protein
MYVKRLEDGIFRCQTTVLRGSRRGIESIEDVAHRGIECTADTGTSSGTEHSSHCGDDAKGNDNVLERHHAGRVLAQTLQRFGGLYIVFQHRRKSLVSR